MLCDVAEESNTASTIVKYFSQWFSAIEVDSIIHYNHQLISDGPG